MSHEKVKAMQALGMDKRAADMLGIGPSKSGTMTKTGPLSGNAAVSSLHSYTRGKTTGASTNAQNAKKPEDEQEETKPGVEKLESSSCTPPKKAPAKKPEEKSENEIEYKEAVLKKIATMGIVPGGIGTIIGGIAGSQRKLDKGEDRIQSIARGGLTGLGTDVGMIGGGIGGKVLGGKLGKTLFPESSPWDAKSLNRQKLVALLGALLGTAGGGYAGYRLSKRKEKKASLRPFRKVAAEDMDFDLSEPPKKMSTTAKVLLGALAGAGIPVALWHGSSPMVRKLVEKIYKLKPLEKLHKLPSTHPRATKALMYAPAAAGGLAGAMSGDDDEFKLSSAAFPIIKAGEGPLAAGNVGALAADEPAPKKDIIPYLGPLGGKLLGGLGGITSGLGMSGVGGKLQEWSENPTARSIAGGGTAAVAALLTALAARKLMRGRQEEAED